MISNTILKSTLEGIKAIAKIDLYLFEPDGKLVCFTEQPDERCEAWSREFAESEADTQSMSGIHFVKIKNKGAAAYVLAGTGVGDETMVFLKLAAFQLQSMVNSDKDRFDKDNFLKNVILDNLLQIDIFERSKKFHVDNEAPRLVYIINVEDDSDNTILDILRPLYGENAGGYVFKVDEQHVIYIRNIAEGEDETDFNAIAANILDVINTEGMQNACISYGNPAPELKDLSRSYKEAGLAMDVGRIFYSSLRIMSYSRLGIGRLIYQLPITLCRMFINEVFGDHDPEDLDEETIQTIDQFFADSLNISEASRNLYIHRNTLVYRLDKLEKTLGLNIRNFDDAMTLKIALMVDTYMNYIEKNHVR